MENQNKNALVTGAGSGIGLALAKKLLKEGYDVIATSRSGKIEGFEHDNLTVVPLELKDEESVANLAGIKAALQTAGNKNHEEVALTGLNHLFQKAKTGSMNEYAEIEETFNPVALEKISTWINGLRL